MLSLPVRRLWRGFALCLLVVGCAPKAQADHEWRSAVWVELTASGAQARTAAVADRCPQAVVDGKAVDMALRRAADGDFPTVCQLPLAADVRAVSIEGRALPLPVAAPRRIVLLGDSGCRIQGTTAQSCNDSKAWPFAEVARLAAAQKPDLVIHVGDYYYREAACPPTKGCADSPYGDHWPTWQAELFDPAAPLLAAAPWLFVRGNHETCERGGRGWFALLDAADRPQACPGASAPFAVDIGGTKLYVLDSAETVDRSAPPRAVARFAEQIAALGPQVEQGRGWIVTHRPIWGQVPVVRVAPLDPLEIGINATEQAAVRGKSLAGVQMIVSGHIHDFQSMSFAAGRPAQLVIGTGGDVGEPADIPKVRGGPRTIDGMTSDFLTFDRFGYLLLERAGEEWTGAFHDAQDRSVATCRLHGRALTCVKAP